MPYHVYILENPQGRFYIGHTDDLQRRLAEHNEADGKAHLGKYTHRNGPWALVWTEEHPDRSSAMMRFYSVFFGELVQNAVVMKLLYLDRYGDSGVLSIREVPKPEPGPGQVVVRVHAASVNPLDWRLMRADPFLVRMSFGLFRPKFHCLGADFSGVVESTADDVSAFRPGEAVFGVMTPDTVGSFAEYITVAESGLVGKPDGLSHLQAATLGIAALTAYEGIHDYRAIQPSDRVLIHGASGGVGTFAVQMAKALGAHVTAVCSGRNQELVRDLGADELIDYTRVDLTRIEERFALIFDTVGNHAPKKMKRLLSEEGRLVLISARSGFAFINGVFLSKNKKEPVDMIIGLKTDRSRLQAVLDLVVSGKVHPVIDREYPFDEAVSAIDYVATKHARGKVVIRMQ